MFRLSECQDEPFFIAEVGQNHQGRLDYAIKYIEIFSREGASAIKFQTRNNKILFSPQAYNKLYDSEHSFATTYGKHREALELPEEAIPILIKACHAHNVKFISTPFDIPSLEILTKHKPDALKISSFDLGNLPFISKIAAANLPTLFSTGGGKMSHVSASAELIASFHDDYGILHCVSRYPCEPQDLSLGTINDLISAFPSVSIGLSDHFNGILSAPLGYTLGARIFEKHVTLNRAWIGSDHSFSLEPDGFRKLVRDVTRVPKMLQKRTSSTGNEQIFSKLGKSLTAAMDLPTGSIISLQSLASRIFDETYIPVRDSHSIIGCRLNRDMLADQPLKYDYLDCA